MGSPKETSCRGQSSITKMAVTPEAAAHVGENFSTSSGLGRWISPPNVPVLHQEMTEESLRDYLPVPHPEDDEILWGDESQVHGVAIAHDPGDRELPIDLGTGGPTTQPGCQPPRAARLVQATGTPGLRNSSSLPPGRREENVDGGLWHRLSWNSGSLTL